MRILDQAVPKILCWKGFSIVLMAESKKGHNFAIQGPTKKNTFRLFCVVMLHIKFQVPSSSGSLVLQQTKSVTDRQTDVQTEIRISRYRVTRFLYCYNGRVEKGA